MHRHQWTPPNIVDKNRVKTEISFWVSYIDETFYLLTHFYIDYYLLLIFVIIHVEIFEDLVLLVIIAIESVYLAVICPLFSNFNNYFKTKPPCGTKSIIRSKMMNRRNGSINHYSINKTKTYCVNLFTVNILTVSQNSPIETKWATV